MKYDFNSTFYKKELSYGINNFLIFEEMLYWLVFWLDAREPLPDMTQNLFRKLFGDRGYITQRLFDKLLKNCLVISNSRYISRL